MIAFVAAEEAGYNAFWLTSHFTANPNIVSKAINADVKYLQETRKLFGLNDEKSVSDYFDANTRNMINRYGKCTGRFLGYHRHVHNGIFGEYIDKYPHPYFAKEIPTTDKFAYKLMHALKTLELRYAKDYGVAPDIIQKIAEQAKQYEN